jgi:hypothetical protein
LTKPLAETTVSLPAWVSGKTVESACRDARRDAQGLPVLSEWRRDLFSRLGLGIIDSHTQHRKPPLQLLRIRSGAVPGSKFSLEPANPASAAKRCCECW